MSVMHEKLPVVIAAQDKRIPSLLLATSIREPISRLISSFHFEGNNDPKLTCSGSCTFLEWVSEMKKRAADSKGSAASAKASMAAVTARLEQRERNGETQFSRREHRLLEKIKCERMQSSENKNTSLCPYVGLDFNLWNTVENYYTHVFSGEPLTTAIAERDYRAALVRLAAFDVVFITERFKGGPTSSEQHALMNTLLPPPPLLCAQRLNVSAAALAAVRRQRSSRGRGVVETVNANKNRGKQADRGPTTAEELELQDPNAFKLVQDLNSWDVRLYEFALKLNHVLVGVWSRALNQEQEHGQPCHLPCPVEVPRLGMRLAPRLDQAELAPDFGCARPKTPAKRRMPVKQPAKQD
jgi:hypothetical protein